MSIFTFFHQKPWTISTATAGDGQVPPETLQKNHDLKDGYEDGLSKEIRVKCAGCSHESRVIVPKKTGHLPPCPYCLRTFLEAV